MAMILSPRPTAGRRAPGSTRLAQWLDERAPVLILAAMLAILAAAAGEAGASAAPLFAAPRASAE